ncbi:UDP-N-acetylmuramate dehydrogenase [Alkalihalobacterium chitinilyticum]|uniref:UDP-N-acetylenolpyruvoylglucosamine reductase n=1 Tax=Alkalihalobacterium chitinilyticum TaxID=2980103 RepID=A0ABT5VC78_9BACI|nr:UDP-N-acetylmuramate dehydrogenase [Alkalihalobacterium chitinilyticum]MDE5413058.1 UDP-N-acetylmuramate dehydrogenase [Alkalihalobacterium chitinilyticum]
MEQFIQQLREKNIGKVLVQEPLANHTTWKIGGPAEFLVEPKDVEALKELMILIRQNKIPWRVIGRGSNLLVSDSGIEGVVIKLGDGISHLEIDGEEIKVGGGFSVIKLAMVISKKGLSGLEFASGIPGSVGGAVFMNAGAHGSDISQILTKAHILFEDGTMKWLTNEELQFSYRTSRLQKEKAICVEAVFQLKAGDRDEIVKVMQKNKDYRRVSQPWNYPCAGSVFRNPLPNYAGQLIEKAGLKGFQLGGAQVSEMHGNFIVNVAEAKADDVLKLIQHIKTTIRDEFEVEIETEVEIVGKKQNND